MTASTSSFVPSPKATVDPAASTALPWSRTPWRRRMARSDRQVDLARGRQLLGDLEAGVATAHDEHAPARNGVRRPVLGAVQLENGGIEALRDRRDERHLERPRRHDHLIGLVGAVVELDDVAGAALADRADRAVQFYGQVEMTGVTGEVVRDLVPTGVTVRITVEREAGQGVVADRGKQPERVPAPP